MANYAQAYFDRSLNSWAVGYYDSSRAGGAEAYTTFRTEDDAKREANRFNASQPLSDAERAFVLRIRERCAAALSVSVDEPFFYLDEDVPIDARTNRLAMDHHILNRYRAEKARHPAWSEDAVIDLLIHG